MPTTYLRSTTEDAYADLDEFELPAAAHEALTSSPLRASSHLKLEPAVPVAVQSSHSRARRSTFTRATTRADRWFYAATTALMLASSTGIAAILLGH